MICVLGATYKEISLLLSSLVNVQSLNLGKSCLWWGKIKKQNLIVALTGIGPVNAVHMTTLLLQNYPIKIFILTGCGGAFPEIGLELGDIALANEEIWAEAGAYTEEGWRPLAEINLPYWDEEGKRLFHRFPLKGLYTEFFGKEISNLLSSKTFKIGPFITVLASTGNQQRLKVLKQRFPEGICENMEGAAVAQVCQIYKLPFLEIRGISNFLGEYRRANWEIDLATSNVQKIIIELLERHQKWPF